MPPPSGQWNKLSYLNGLISAIRERQLSINSSAISTTSVGARADVLVARMQNALANGGFYYPRYDSSGWVAPGTDITGFKLLSFAEDSSVPYIPVLTSGGSSSIPDISRRSYCGLPTQGNSTWPRVMTQNTGTPVYVVPPTSYQSDFNWRTIRPRRINNLTDTTDVEKNPAVSGQIAYLGHSGSSSWINSFTGMYGETWNMGPEQPESGPYNFYKIAIYNGSTWVLTRNVYPDMLDSVNAPPNWCCPGVAVVGDYIGAHIFIELEAIINCTNTFISENLIPQDGYDSGSTVVPTPRYSGVGASASAAEASAIGNITHITGTATPFMSVGRTVGAAGEVDSQSYFVSGSWVPGYNAGTFRSSPHCILPASPVASNSVDFYVFPQRFYSGSLLSVYDDESTGFNQTTIAKLVSGIMATSPSALSSPFPGSSSTGFGTLVPDPPAPAGSATCVVGFCLGPILTGANQATSLLIRRFSGLSTV